MAPDYKKSYLKSWILNTELRRLRTEAFERVNTVYKDSPLRPGQKKVFKHLWDNDTVLLRAPTGWGKSRIFQGFRHMFDYSKTPVDQRGITIIICPLLGLGDSQVQELNNPQILGGSAGTAIFLNGDSSPKDLKDVVLGRYRVVYLSPEKADSDEVRKSMWFSANFRHLVQLVAVDEAHLVDEWYPYRVIFYSC